MHVDTSKTSRDFNIQFLNSEIYKFQNHSIRSPLRIRLFHAVMHKKDINSYLKKIFFNFGEMYFFVRIIYLTCACVIKIK